MRIDRRPMVRCPDIRSSLRKPARSRTFQDFSFRVSTVAQILRSPSSSNPNRTTSSSASIAKPRPWKSESRLNPTFPCPLSSPSSPIRMSPAIRPASFGSMAKTRSVPCGYCAAAHQFRYLLVIFPLRCPSSWGTPRGVDHLSSTRSQRHGTPLAVRFAASTRPLNRPGHPQRDCITASYFTIVIFDRSMVSATAPTTTTP